MDFSGTHLIHEKLIELMPVNVYVDPEKSGEKRQQTRAGLSGRYGGLSNCNFIFV